MGAPCLYRDPLSVGAHYLHGPLLPVGARNYIHISGGGTASMPPWLLHWLYTPMTVLGLWTYPVKVIPLLDTWEGQIVGIDCGPVEAPL